MEFPLEETVVRVSPCWDGSFRTTIQWTFSPEADSLPTIQIILQVLDWLSDTSPLLVFHQGCQLFMSVPDGELPPLSSAEIEVPGRLTMSFIGKFPLDPIPDQLAGSVGIWGGSFFVFLNCSDFIFPAAPMGEHTRRIEAVMHSSTAGFTLDELNQLCVNRGARLVVEQVIND